MKCVLCLASFLLATTITTLVRGHGIPITVGVQGDRLVVSQVPEPADYPAYLFVQPGEDGDPFGAPTLPNMGPVVAWQVPGLEISGMDDQSSLSIEVLPRKVGDSSPAEERILWYWNSQTETVEAAPDTQAFYLLGTGMRYATLAPPDGPAPPPFMLAEFVAGQQGFHNHGLLSYALGNSPAAAAGAYGFYARLTSSQYEASDPFLLMFDYGVDYAQMLPAALAINAAAVDPDVGEELFGDYNGNGLVDAADYTAWRDAVAAGLSALPNRDPSKSGLVDESDFVYWRDHFGDTPAAGEAASAAVPEPTAWLLAAVAAVMLKYFVRRNSQPPCAGAVRA